MQIRGSWLGRAALATLLLGGAAVPGEAADPLFAHEQPRYRSGAELLDELLKAIQEEEQDRVDAATPEGAFPGVASRGARRTTRRRPGTERRPWSS